MSWKTNPGWDVGCMCFLAGTVLCLLPMPGIFFGMPLLVSAAILALMEISQGRLRNGVPLLLMSITAGALICYCPIWLMTQGLKHYSENSRNDYKEMAVAISNVVQESFPCRSLQSESRKKPVSSQVNYPPTESLYSPDPRSIEGVRNDAEMSKKIEVSSALKRHQTLADKGDPYGMFRMGQRYLRGDGVEKDMVKARLLLGKAAIAGSEEAKAELARLNGD